MKTRLKFGQVSHPGMTRLFAVCGLLSIAACTTVAERTPAPETTFFYYPEGVVRSIDLRLQITEYKRLEGGELRIIAKGKVENEDITLGALVGNDWKFMPNSPPERKFFRFTFTVLRVDGTETALDRIVRRSFGDTLNLFGPKGFSMVTGGIFTEMEKGKTQFGGFAISDKDGEFSPLQCLSAVDIPNMCVKIAILIEGYGGTPPKAVDKWLSGK
jgi:hypothetical protein